MLDMKMVFKDLGTIARHAFDRLNYKWNPRIKQNATIKLWPFSSLCSAVRKERRGQLQCMKMQRQGHSQVRSPGRRGFLVLQAGCLQQSQHVGNMMQSVVLDGNPLNEDEDM